MVPDALWERIEPLLPKRERRFRYPGRLPVPGRFGRPRRSPDSLFADRGYDHDIYRDQVRARGIVPAIARRNT
ncbi:transposase, partial [Streptomyces griseoflavus]